MLIFFFKQKTAYEMRISDWSSDVCSSDLIGGPLLFDQLGRMELTMKEFNPQVSAVEALGALAHDTRLSVFRMLVKAGPEGLIAGAIAQAANVPPSTMSHHLGILERAGLVEYERESRLIH